MPKERPADPLQYMALYLLLISCFIISHLARNMFQLMDRASTKNASVILLHYKLKKERKMYALYEYSGLIAAFVSVLTILVPTYRSSVDYNSDPLSVIVQDKWRGRIFQSGLVVTGLLLILFCMFMFSSQLAFMYMLGCGCMIAGGLVRYDRSHRFHNAAVRLYFLLSVLGEIIISGMLQSEQKMFLAILGGVGTAAIYHFLKKTAYAELWGISFAIFWVVSFYL